MTFQEIYDSTLQHPGIAWTAAFVTAYALARRQPFLVAWSASFLVVSVADALATGALSPVPKSEAWIAGVVFVILGDARFFLVGERAVRGRFGARAALVGFGLALIVPISTEIVRRVVPAVAETPRATFLVYELSFLVIAVVLRLFVYPRRLVGVPAPIRQWMLSVATFQIVQYALWALADVILLLGVDAGLLLRIVPNAMYYGAFLPFVILRAPKQAWVDG